MIFKDVYSITLREYIDLVCNDNLSVLKKISIPVSKKALIEAYTHLINQYEELTTNPDVKAKASKRERKNRLIQRHLEINACLVVLNRRESKICTDFLVRKMVIGKNDKREAKVSKCIAVLKGLKTEIEQMPVKKEKVTIGDFDRSIAMLRKSGYTVDKGMFLSEYIQIENLAREEYELNRSVSIKRSPVAVR